jgi:hypothetical protein
MVHLVTHPDLELYVTWAALENSLKGLRDDLDLLANNNKSKGQIISEQRFTQTVRPFFSLSIFN